MLWITQPLKIIHDGLRGQCFHTLETAARRQLHRQSFGSILLYYYYFLQYAIGCNGMCSCLQSVGESLRTVAIQILWWSCDQSTLQPVRTKHTSDIYIYILSILGLVGKTIILKDSVRRSNWVFSQPWKWVRINWTIFRVCLQSMPDIFWSRLVMRLMGCFCLLFFIKIEFCLFHGQELLILKLILSYLALSWLWKDSGRMG